MAGIASDSFAAALRGRIVAACRAGGYRLGWRLLASPANTLDGAEVAFIGLNPGGAEERPDHAEFAMEPGRSAYRDESWGAAPGAARLQREVLALFGRIGVAPEEVLAGNLVPFRSPSWTDLHDRRAALAFGAGLWRDILARARPKLVIAMGAESWRALAAILEAGPARRVPLAWGRVAGRAAAFPGGRLTGLPHLSRFPIVTREASRSGLAELFPGT